MGDDHAAGDPVVHRCGGLIEAEVDGELVALHVDKGTCYGFNGTATRIWSMLAEPQRFSALRDALVAQFDVGCEPCTTELRTMLHTLEAEGLVELRTGDASA